MPKAEESQVFIELTLHSLHALRAVNGTVEAGGECALENKAALEALLDAVAPSRKTGVIKAACAVWPGSVRWHVSNDTEAMLDRTPEALRAIAAAKQDDPKTALAYAACNAGDGGNVTPEGTENWILAFCSRESLAQVSAKLSGLKLDAAGPAPAAFAAIGAVSSALQLDGKGGAVALWDLGAENSHLLVVTAKGVEAVAPCAVGMEAIFEAVQSVLKLKFRGAGARLFFNDGYDFTDPGPKVAAIVGARLKEALSRLPPPQNPPALACLGLTGKQAWFSREVAAAAGMPKWEPDLGKLAAELGLKFSDDAVAASFSQASAGLLGLASSRIRARNDWNPGWVEAEAPVEDLEPTPEPAKEPDVAAEPPPVERPVVAPTRTRPTLSTQPVPAPGAFPQRSTRPPAPTRSMTVPPVPSAAPPPPEPPPPAPLPSATRPSIAPPPVRPYVAPSAPAFPSPAASAQPQSYSKPGFPAPKSSFPELAAKAPLPPGPPSPVPWEKSVTPAGTTPPTPAVTALPFEAVKLRPVAAAARLEPPPPKSKVGFYIGLGVVSALVFAAIAVVLEARLEKIKADDLEQQEALAHHNAEEQLKEAERNAKTTADRNRKELEAAIELTRKQTEEATRLKVLAEMEAERLAKLPGALVVTTVPPGASVSIDGAAPLTSPVKADGIAPGSHSVKIFLAGHEPVDMNVEIKGSKTTDLGSIPLQSVYGTVVLSSTPGSLDFAIRPAETPAGKPIRTGRTPATVDDVTRGDYIVTFSRPGCRDHTGTVSVEKGVRSEVSTRYLDGSLELTSDPSGARVSKDGAFLGTTPLVLHDLTPKLATFDLTLPGYDSTPILCEIPEGDTLKYSAQLLRKDRIFKPSEVKTLPESYEAPQPVLSASQRKTGAEVLLSFVVRRDGTVTDVIVARSTDDDIARRCKMAVEKWLFRPATAPDGRTVDARIEMPFKFSAAPQ